MDHIANLATSGLLAMANLEGAEMEMFSNDTCPCPGPPFAGCPGAEFWFGMFDRINTYNSELTITWMLFAFLVVWVRRNVFPNQKAIVAGFAVESFFSLMTFIASKLTQSRSLSCFPSPGWATILPTVLDVLTRVGQIVTGIMAQGKPAAGGGFAAACLTYFLVYFLMQIFTSWYFGNGANPVVALLGSFFEDRKMKMETVYAFMRSFPGFGAGLILWMNKNQVDPHSEEVEIA